MKHKGGYKESDLPTVRLEGEGKGFLPWVWKGERPSWGRWVRRGKGASREGSARQQGLWDFQGVGTAEVEGRCKQVSLER